MSPPPRLLISLAPLALLALAMCLGSLLSDIGFLCALLAAELLAILGSAVESALEARGRGDLMERAVARNMLPRAERLIAHEGSHLLTAKLVRFVGNGLLVIGLAWFFMIREDSEGVTVGNIAAVVGLAFLLSFVLNDVLVRLYVAKRPEDVLLVTEPTIEGLRWLFLPIRLPLVWLARLIFRENIDAAGPSAREEVLETVEEGEREGSLTADEAGMIESVMRFKGHQAKTVMTPRADMVMVPTTEPLLAAVRMMIDEGVSRVPVYGKDRDEVVGLLYARDLLVHLENNDSDSPLSRATAADAMRTPVFFVPGSKPLPDLLQEMRSRKVHLAIVIDEFNGTDGLVTIEDVLEEIVGEIEDEYDDEEADTASPEEIASGTLAVEGRTPIEEVNAALAVKLPVKEDFETVGGLVFHHLGQVPRAGDKVDVDGVRLTVIEADDRTVQRLRVQVLD